jgi:hypothetical protein
MRGSCSQAVRAGPARRHPGAALEQAAPNLRPTVQRRVPRRHRPGPFSWRLVAACRLLLAVGARRLCLRLQPSPAGLLLVSACPGAFAMRRRPLCGSDADRLDQFLLRAALLARRA